MFNYKNKKFYLYARAHVQAQCKKNNQFPSKILAFSSHVNKLTMIFMNFRDDRFDVSLNFWIRRSKFQKKLASWLTLLIPLICSVVNWTLFADRNENNGWVFSSRKKLTSRYLRIRMFLDGIVKSCWVGAKHTNEVQGFQFCALGEKDIFIISRCAFKGDLIWVFIVVFGKKCPILSKKSHAHWFQDIKTSPLSNSQNR